MKNRKLLYTALSASLLLAACGTDTSEEDNDKTTVENTDQAEDTGAEGSDVTGSETEDTEAADEDTASDEEAAEDDSTSDSSDSEADSSDAEDAAALEGAVETDSDEQDFKIQVLPAYELTSEEPGRDVLYLKEQEDKYMVIGTMSAADTDFDKAVENMTETLAATSTDATPVELTDAAQLPTNKDLEKVQAYRVTSAEGPITAMIYQKGDMVVRVMMYDNNDESYYEEFLKMAETIEAK